MKTIKFTSLALLWLASSLVSDRAMGECPPPKEIKYTPGSNCQHCTYSPLQNQIMCCNGPRVENPREDCGKLPKCHAAGVSLMCNNYRDCQTSAVMVNGEPMTQSCPETTSCCQRSNMTPPCHWMPDTIGSVLGTWKDDMLNHTLDTQTCLLSVNYKDSTKKSINLTELVIGEAQVNGSIPDTIAIINDNACINKNEGARNTDGLGIVYNCPK